MPTFTATDRDGVIDFLVESYTEDPRLSYSVEYSRDDDDDLYAQPSFTCLYRSPEGAACAFGRCVTDKEIGGLSIECKKASDVIELLALRGTFYEIASADWWNSLQKIHDSVAQMGDQPKYNHLQGANIPTLLKRWRELGYPYLDSYEGALGIIT